MTRTPLLDIVLRGAVVLVTACAAEDDAVAVSATWESSTSSGSSGSSSVPHTSSAATSALAEGTTLVEDTALATVTDGTGSTQAEFSESRAGSGEGMESTSSIAASSESTAAMDASGTTESEPPPERLEVAPDTYRTGFAEDLVVSAARGVLSNDPAALGLQGPSVRVVEGSSVTAAGALVELEAGGAFVYRPAAGHWGTDRFEYQVRSDGGGEGQGEVVVEVAHPTTRRLSRVANGVGGFAIDGSAAGDLGGIVGAAGDVDGDGLSDVLVGAEGAGEAGEAAVVFGKGDGARVVLGQLGDGEGMRLLGEQPGDGAGFFVGGLGDVDGDPSPDMFVASRALEARVFVIFGQPEGGSVPLAEIAQGEGGFAIDDLTVGRSWAAAGDINGDSRGDLVIGAPTANADGTLRGQCIVVFGKSDGTEVSLARLDASIGFIIDGLGDRDGLGLVVAGAGDVSGDGLDDLALYAPRIDATPRVYVVFGAVGLSEVQLDDVVAGAGGFVIEVGDAGVLGAISAAGDVNGDGQGDLLLGGAFLWDNAGGGAVVFGAAQGDAVDLTALAASGRGFPIFAENDGDRAGSAVAGVGDLDGDGLADLLLGAPRAPAGEGYGRAYAVFGRAASDPVLLEAVGRGVGGFAIDGEWPGDRAGASVGGGGDFDGDGRFDLLVGAPEASPTGVRSGRAYVVSGASAD